MQFLPYRVLPSEQEMLLQGTNNSKTVSLHSTHASVLTLLTIKLSTSAKSV